MTSDLIKRLEPILRKNGWGNVSEYARFIPSMLEREGLIIMEAAQIAHLTSELQACKDALAQAGRTSERDGHD